MIKNILLSALNLVCEIFVQSLNMMMQDFKTRLEFCIFNLWKKLKKFDCQNTFGSSYRSPTISDPRQGIPGSVDNRKVQSGLILHEKIITRDNKQPSDNNNFRHDDNK